MAYNAELPINESPGPAAYSARRHGELSRISTTIGRASRDTGQWWGASCAPGLQTPGAGSYDAGKAWKRASSWYGSCSRSSQSARMLKSRDSCLRRGEFVYCDLMGPSFDAGCSHSHSSSDSSILPRRCRSQSPGPGAYNARYSGLSSSFHKDVYIDRSPRGPCLSRGEFLVRDLRHTQREVGTPTTSRAPSTPSSPGAASQQASRRTPSRGAPHAVHPWLSTPKGSKTAQAISQGPCLPLREAAGGRDFRPPSRSSSALRSRGGTPMGSGTPNGTGASKGTGAPRGSGSPKGAGHPLGLQQVAAQRVAAEEVPAQPPMPHHSDDLAAQEGASVQEFGYELEPRQLLWEADAGPSQLSMEDSPMTRARKIVSLRAERAEEESRQLLSLRRPSPLEQQAQAELLDGWTHRLSQDLTPQGSSDVEQVQLGDQSPKRSSLSQAAELPLRAPPRSSVQEDGHASQPQRRAPAGSSSSLAARRPMLQEEQLQGGGFQQDVQPAEPQLGTPSRSSSSLTAPRPALQEEQLQREGAWQDVDPLERQLRTPSRSSSSAATQRPALQQEQLQRGALWQDDESAEPHLRTPSRSFSSVASSVVARGPTLQEEQLQGEAARQEEGPPTEPQLRAPSRSSVSSAAPRPLEAHEEHPQKDPQPPTPSSRRSRGSSQRISVHSAEWQVKQDNRWQDLGADTCRLLFEAEAIGQTKVEVASGIGKYLFDIEGMTQLNLKTKRVRQLRKFTPAPSS